jgi:hypothetical protein
MTYSAGDPATWSPTAAAGFVVGVDIGLAQDHSAMVVGAPWPRAQMAIGIVEIRRFALGTPHNEIADAVSLAAHKHRAKIVVEGHHDDLVVALSLCVFGARRLVAMPRPFAMSRRSGFDKRAWS